MQIVEDQIRQSVEELWASVLGLAIEQRPSPSFPETSADLLTGCIQISGAWEGAVTLDCGTTLARQAAAIMFGVELGETSYDQVQDALGELTNILGGQIKALLPEPCRLSMPAVAGGEDLTFRDAHGKVLASLAFACQDAPVRVTIAEGKASR
jgi:chemotaxis protein CheX